MVTGWGEPSPLVTPLLVAIDLRQHRPAVRPHPRRGPTAGDVFPAACCATNRGARLCPAGYHHLRTRRSGAFHLLPVLTVPDTTPPTELVSADVAATRVRLPWPRVLMICVLAFGVWLLLFRPHPAAQRAGLPGGDAPHGGARHSRADRGHEPRPAALAHRLGDRCRHGAHRQPARERFGGELHRSLAPPAHVPGGRPHTVHRSGRDRPPRRPRRSPPSIRVPPTPCVSSSSATRWGSTWAGRCRTTWPTPAWSPPPSMPMRAPGSPVPTISTGRRSCSPTWPRSHPQVVVIMIGANDPQDFPGPPDVPYTSPQWNPMYAARVAAFMQLAASGGAKVIWVGMPPMQNADLSAKMDDLNTIVQQQAALAKAARQLPQHLGPARESAGHLHGLHHQRVGRGGQCARSRWHPYDARRRGGRLAAGAGLPAEPAPLRLALTGREG